MSIFAPVSSTMPWIVFPPGPMTMRILSGSMCIVMILGAYGESSFLGSASSSSISFMICIRPSLACARASWRISLERPWTLMSICMAVTPFSVPVTLKSMSPRKSSIPWISERMAIFCDPSSSILSTRPIAMPATGALIGTPASMRAIVLPHVEAIELDPLDERISLTTLIAYGNSSLDGSTGSRARSARAPCPISLLPGLLIGLVSPTEYPGKL